MSRDSEGGVGCVGVVIIVLIVLFCTGYFDKPKKDAEKKADPPAAEVRE